MKKSALALLFCLLTPRAFAAPGTEAPVHPNYTNVYDNAGMCVSTKGNDKNHYWKSGHCKTILESLEKNECIAKKLEEIRLRMLSDEDPARQNASRAVREKNQLKLGLTCASKNDENQNFDQVIVKDKKKFAMFMMQFFSLIVTQQSKWQVNHGGNNSNQRDVKCETNCGLLGINKKDMENPKYSCGCEIPNKTDDQKQFDPTMDGHLNLRCGITMALFQATEDKDASDLFGGRAKDPNQEGKDTRSAMAKVFKSLEVTDADVKNPQTPPYDTPLKQIKGKMTNYCETEAFATGVQRDLERQLRETDGLNDIGMPRSTTR